MIKKKRIPWNKGLRGVQNHTEETKKKISKNNGRGFLGKKHTKETKKKMSISHLGKKYKPMSLEGRNNISKALIGRVFSEEHKKNLSLAAIKRYAK